MAKRRVEEKSFDISEEKIVSAEYSDEMRKSFLDYSMSVLVSRAVPDIRDGLKPVHRRILYAMKELGLTNDKPHRKSANVVGQTLSNWHPHGDASVYEAMVNLSHDFSLTTPLVDGHGNFGSIEGDAFAASRYCITGDSLIITNKGIMPIEELEKWVDNKENLNNIEVYNYKGENVTAPKFFNSGKQPVYKIVLKNGSSITGTSNHPLMVLDKNLKFAWKTIEKISEGDNILIPRIQNIEFNNDNQTDDNLLMAAALGSMISKGYITTQNRIGINNKDIELILPVYEWFKLLHPEMKAKICENVKRGYYEFCVASPKLYGTIIDEYGYENRAKDKTIPSVILKSKKLTSMFLRYLFEGDGSVSVSNVVITYGTYSKKLAKQIQIVLNQYYGIFSSVHKMQRKTGIEYKVYITGDDMIRYQSEIGFVSDKKKEKLKGAITSYNNKEKIAINSYGNIYAISEYIRNKYPSFFTKTNSFSNLKNIEKCKKIVTEEEYDYFKYILNNYAEVPVKEVLPLEEKTVYSVRVNDTENSHSFIANGFINHNTEARLQKYTEDVILQDLSKTTVDYMPNYDNSKEEPVVLPSKVPNVLINGTNGIAVGTTTSTPPHNLKEVIDAYKLYLKNNSVTTENLLNVLHGPDFPTGGIVVNKSDLLEIYQTGIGKIKLRGKVEFEQSNGRGDHDKLVITEIPYTMIGLGIEKFLSDVAELAKAKILPEVTDILNQTTSSGVRLVIELKSGSDIERVKNILYKKTKLEDTLPVNMLYVVKGTPITLNLVSVFREFSEFNIETQKRKFTSILNKNKEILEIREGLIKAIDIIDTIIEILRGSKNLKAAKNCLMGIDKSDINFKTKKSEKIASELNFTELQAQSILDMKLSRLINLELVTLTKEKSDAEKTIQKCEKILSSPKEMIKIIVSELDNISEKYARERKTQIIDAEIVEVNLNTVEEYETVVTYDKFGYVKSYDITTYNRNKDAIEENSNILRVKNTSNIFVFTNVGNLHQIKVMDIPLCKFRDRGVPLDNICNYNSTTENIINIFSMDELKNNKFVFITKNNLIKIVDGKEMITSRKTILSTKLIENDEIVAIDYACPKHLIIQSNNNYFLRIKQDEIPEQKRNSNGVKCMSLKDNDFIKKVYFVDKEAKEICIGKDKTVAVLKIKLAGRATNGQKIQ